MQESWSKLLGKNNMVTIFKAELFSKSDKAQTGASPETHGKIPTFISRLLSSLALEVDRKIHLASKQKSGSWAVAQMIATKPEQFLPISYFLIESSYMNQQWSSFILLYPSLFSKDVSLPWLLKRTSSPSCLPWSVQSRKMALHIPPRNFKTTSYKALL